MIFFYCSNIWDSYLNTDTILQLLESGKNVDVIFLDFAKAFDKVKFSVVREKIKKARYKREAIQLDQVIPHQP